MRCRKVANSKINENRQTRGELEVAIRNAIIQFEQEFMGRGPTDVRAFIVQDIILVRLKGCADASGAAIGQKCRRGWDGQTNARKSHWTGAREVM